LALKTVVTILGDQEAEWIREGEGRGTPTKGEKGEDLRSTSIVSLVWEHTEKGITGLNGGKGLPTQHRTL